MNLSLILVMSLTATSVFAGDWNRANNPANFGRGMEYRFDALPTKAMLPPEKMPWSETYWPSNEGSINYRWNAKDPIGFGYQPPTREEVLKMTKDQLKELSPSEKYDIAMGRYDYPVKKEVDGYANPRAMDWNGICHGWAPAALQFKEPKPVEIVNPDGVVVPFGSSDVKGLLSFFMAYHAETGGVSQIGVRCRSWERTLGLPMCKDVNAGAFHVAVTNELGLKGKGFVAEIEPGNEIWNQPVYGYEVNAVASARSSNSDNAVQVKLTLYYTDELDDSQWEPVVGTEHFSKDKVELEYILELDSSGKITGGGWISEYHPDFIWKMNGDAAFTGKFEGLNQIYQPN